MSQRTRRSVVCTLPDVFPDCFAEFPTGHRAAGLLAGPVGAALPRERRARMAGTERGVSVRKTPGGRWRGVVKSGRDQVASRTFDTRRQASAWVARERAAIAGGVDPRAGRRTVRALLPEWLQEREPAVSRKTFVADSALPRLIPPALAALQIGAVTDREVTRCLIGLNPLRTGRVLRTPVPSLTLGVLRLGGPRAADPRQPGHRDAHPQGTRGARRDPPVR